jgi:dihydroorotase
MSLPLEPSGNIGKINQLTIIRPDDWHVHLRDGVMMQAVLQHTAQQFARAIVMPNLKDPVTTTAQAIAYRSRIVSSLPAGSTFTPLMTLYLTDKTSAQEIQQAFDSGVVHGVKLYPAGATTNSSAGVSDLKHCTAALDAMQKVGMPLLVHGEVTDSEIDIFDREAVFIDRVLQPLRKQFPELKVVLEHITTRDAVQYIEEAEGSVGATLTAHHLLYNRNALFKGGIQPHFYCLPILKKEKHRLALLAAATSGNKRFFLGTDSAPHARGAKESACGCAGCYTALHAMSLYTRVFEQTASLDRLEAFASFHGADFYGLPRNTETVTITRSPWVVPEEIPIGAISLIPLNAGQTMEWALS